MNLRTRTKIVGGLLIGTAVLLFQSLLSTRAAARIAPLDPAEKSPGQSWRGKQLFKQLNCATCHSIDGNAGLGPTMKDYFGSEVQYADGSSQRVDDAHVHEAIIKPNAKIMSGYGPTMPQVDFEKPPRKLSDVDDLVAYIKELAAKKE